MLIEIDSSSGFCFGVTTAINKAEEELAKGSTLYCLGDIVHNGMECDRLREMGLITIDHAQFAELHNAKVLLRAHGEPPETYKIAEQNNIEIIDATCPVVLQLQKRIKKQFTANPNAQIVIFGKNGHAEVLGLVGQTRQRAIVIEHVDEVTRLDFIQAHIAPSANFQWFDTICRQVANRMPNICSFATKHDLILFVSGRKSSNGKVLYNACKEQNPHTYLVEGPNEIDPKWVTNVNSIGICGATSTPKWLMEQVADRIKNNYNIEKK